jgi:hypothetical protein
LLDSFTADVSSTDWLPIGVAIFPDRSTTAVPALAAPEDIPQDAPDEIETADLAAETVDFVDSLFIPPPFAPDHYEHSISSPIHSVQSEW